MQFFSLTIMGLVFFAHPVKGSVPANDSTQTKKTWKISEQQFLDQYGKDDTSRALIRYYFKKRTGFRNASIFTSAGTGVFGFLIQAMAADSRGGRGLDTLGEAFLLLMGFCFLALAAIVVITKWLTMTRRYLFKLIRRFNRGKGIPKRMSSDDLFKKILKEEEQQQHS